MNKRGFLIMKCKIKVSFYVRLRSTKGKYPILMRVAHNGERITLGQTGLFLDHPDEMKRSRILKHSSQYSDGTEFLDRLKISLEMKADELFEQGIFSLETLKIAFLGKEPIPVPTRVMISRFFDKSIEKITEKYEAGLVSKSTYRKYILSKENFYSFLSICHKSSDLEVSDLTKSVVYEYQHYLEVIAGYHRNSAVKFLQLFRVVTNMAIEEGVLSLNPFQNYRCSREPSHIGYLTESELQTIQTTPMPSVRLSLVRDMFVFSCYTGLAYTDVAHLRADHIIVKNGKKWIVKPREKTDVMSYIPMLSVAKEILDKYADYPHSDGRLLPIFSNQKTNKYLKEIGSLLGMDKVLTFHLARHTFATLTLTKGVTIESVSKMLGHSNIKTTQVYAKITPDKIEDEMAQFETKLNQFKDEKAKDNSYRF